MADLLSIPYLDDYESSLAQSWNGTATTIYVNTIPTATTPAGLEYSYIVVDPGKSNMQVRKVTAWAAGTLTVTIDTIKKGNGLNYTPTSHAAGAIVRFSNNYQFWEDIKTAIASKADGGDLGDFTFANDDCSATGTTISLSQTGSNRRIRKDGNDMKFRDDNTPETTLTQLASGGGADQKVAVSATDLTVGVLNDKLTAGDGLSKTIVTPGGAETLDLDVDTADTTVFVKTSSGATDEDKVPVLNASGQLANGFISTTGASGIGLFGGDSSDGVQGDANLTIAGSNNTVIIKNFSSWTAGSVARTCTVTPTNCIVYIKIKGDADFTNWTLNFDGKGGIGGASGNNSPGGTGTNGNSFFDTSENTGGVGSTAIGSAGGGGAGCGSNGSVGSGGSGGSGGIKSISIQYVQESKRMFISCGAGGGGGASNGTATGGVGGTGGGSLIIEVGGNVTFSSTVMTTLGLVGGNGAAFGGAAGGGGGGSFLVLYSGTLTGTCIPTVTGGAGGTGGGTGGVGGNGDYLITKNYTRF